MSASRDYLAAIGRRVQKQAAAAPKRPSGPDYDSRWEEADQYVDPAHTPAGIAPDGLGAPAGMLACDECGDRVPDADQRSEGFSLESACRNIDCDGIYRDA